VIDRPSPGSVPESPGSYQFKDGAGRVIYVGKATNLRARLSNYFADPRGMHPRTAAMVAAAASVEWIEVRNEVEALMLEYNLIKEHRPRFNVRLRDDKSYPFLAVTVDDEWPRATVMRGTRRRGTRYFGPYAQAYAIRETLDLMLRPFPVRTCGDGKFLQHSRLGRPCLLFHIEKCSGPCVGAVDADTYRSHVEGLCRFLAGDAEDTMATLEASMREASDELDYERAGRIRDRLIAVRKASERQQMVGTRDEDADVVAVVEDELEAAVQVFFVRHGRVVGRRGFILDKVEDMEGGRLVVRVLETLYGDEPPLGIPPAVLVSAAPEEHAVVEQWLAQRRGARVSVKVPVRGDKRELLDTVARNASEELVRHRLRRASDHNSRSRALTELQEHLGLPEAPLRIECYDMAHLQGTDYVGSMVVLEDGLPAKREYRRFKIRTVEGNDDYAAMEEVLTRRLVAYLEARETPVAERESSRFAYPPQLLLVDGGKGQLAVARKVVSDLGLDDEIPVAALAKRFEEVFVPGRSIAVRIPRGSEALFMLQRIRDEAHRFANAYHRESRGKSMVASELEGIEGLGPARRRRLLDHFGTVPRMREASREDLDALGWLPAKVVEALWRHLHGSSAPVDETERSDER
jgi:excinuclease ABC subunit C